MRLHSSVITRQDINDAVRAASTAGTIYSELTTHGSRKRDRAFEVKLTGAYVPGIRTRRPNGGGFGPLDTDSGEYALTWDEWGIFLAHLFTIDPGMVATYYSSADDFGRQTGGRFGIGARVGELDPGAREGQVRCYRLPGLKQRSARDRYDSVAGWQRVFES